MGVWREVPRRPAARGRKVGGWSLSFKPRRAGGPGQDLSFCPGALAAHPSKSLKEPECGERLPEIDPGVLCTRVCVCVCVCVRARVQGERVSASPAPSPGF